jgi:metallo-beta-lactamase class B
MRILAVAFLALLSSASAASAQTLRDLLEQLKVAWNAPTEPFRVVGNVYYVGTAGLSSFLITSPQGHVLIDTGLPEANPQIKANIEKLGFKVADIKQLLNTHAHLDHTGGLAGLKQDTGAQLAASAADKPLLEGGYYPGQESDTALNFPPVKVDRVVGEGDKITVGAVTLTALMTPGHSPGCTTWTMTAQENGQDHRVVFFCSGSVALNRLVGTPTHPGIVEDYRKTFARARDIKADVFLAPHPEMFQMKEKRALIREGGANPFVKEGEFNAYAVTLETAFETELAKQTAALEKKN